MIWLSCKIFALVQSDKIKCYVGTVGVTGFENIKIHNIQEKTCDDGITMCKNRTSGLGKSLVFPQADLFGEPNQTQIV